MMMLDTVTFPQKKKKKKLNVKTFGLNSGQKNAFNIAKVLLDQIQNEKCYAQAEWPISLFFSVLC